MSTWINVSPQSANIPRTEMIRGIQVQVFASPHDVPIAVRGYFDNSRDRFVIDFKYVDEDHSGRTAQTSDDGILRVLTGASSDRVETIEVDVKKRSASAIKLNILVDSPNELIEQVEARLDQLRGKAASVARRLNYQAVSEALEQSKDSMAFA